MFTSVRRNTEAENRDRDAMRTETSSGSTALTEITQTSGIG